jgi:glycosyltransferase involved in cell wall biosynthesis
MELEILAATMNGERPVFLEPGLASKAVIVDQCGKDEVFIDGKEHWYHSKSVGLSLSRNLAISNASGDALLITDNDVVINDRRIKDILGKLDLNQVGAVIFKDKHGYGASWPQVRTLNYIDVLKVCSWQICIISKNLGGVRFDQRFGLGSGAYNSGEENIFLTDILRENQKVLFIPVVAVDHPDEGTGAIFNDIYYDTKVAAFIRMFGSFRGRLLVLLMFFKKAIEGRNIRLGYGVRRIFRKYNL